MYNLLNGPLFPTSYILKNAVLRLRNLKRRLKKVILFYDNYLPIYIHGRPQERQKKAVAPPWILEFNLLKVLYFDDLKNIYLNFILLKFFKIIKHGEEKINIRFFIRVTLPPPHNLL